MRRSGRVSLVTLLVVVALVMVAIVFAFSKAGPGVAGGEFMDALVLGDVNKLTELSYVGDLSQDDIKKQWEFTTQVAGKHYNFAWRITSTSVTGNTASVRLSVQRNFGNPGAYDDNYALPMVQVDGKWKVDVAAISREMYPGLPRGKAGI